MSTFTMNHNAQPIAPQAVYPQQNSFLQQQLTPSSTPALTRSSTSTPSCSTPEPFTKTVQLSPESSDCSEIFYNASPYVPSGHQGGSSQVESSTVPTEASVSEAASASSSFTAEQYIPTIARQRAHTVGVSVTEFQWLPLRTWIQDLRRGSVVGSEASIREQCAQDVVRKHEWDRTSISELAAKFCERITEGPRMSPPPGKDDAQTSLAAYAVELYAAFHSHFGEESASLFQEQLGRCLLTEFYAWWSVHETTSVVHFPMYPVPPHVPHEQNFSTALAVAAFIGDLFSLRFIPPAYVETCLNTIVDNLTVVEELTGIHAILSHSNRYLRLSIDFRSMLDEVQARVSQMSERSSILRSPSVPAEVSSLFSRISNIITNWEGELESMQAQVPYHSTLPDPSVEAPQDLTSDPYAPDGQMVAPPGITHPSNTNQAAANLFIAAQSAYMRNVMKNRLLPQASQPSTSAAQEPRQVPVYVPPPRLAHHQRRLKARLSISEMAVIPESESEEEIEDTSDEKTTQGTPTPRAWADVVKIRR